MLPIVPAAGTELTRQAELIDVVRQQGTSMLDTLRGAWAGPDVESFAASWSTVERSVGEASTAVRVFAQEAHRNADDQVAASGGAGPVLVLSTSDWSPVRTLVEDVKTQSLALAPGGEQAAVADSASHEVLVLPLDGGASRTIEPGSDKARCLRWSPTGDELFVLTEEGLTGWDPATGRSSATFEMGES